MTDDPLAPVLAGTTPPGVLSWPAGLPTAQAVDAARAAQWEAAVLDLSGVTDKAGLMTAFADALRLPEWFGANWDALADSLTDLEWWPTRGGRLILVREWQVFAKARPDEWGVLQEIFADAAARWRETDTGLVVLMALG